MILLRSSAIQVRLEPAIPRSKRALPPSATNVEGRTQKNNCFISMSFRCLGAKSYQSWVGQAIAVPAGIPIGRSCPRFRRTCPCHTPPSRTWRERGGRRRSSTRSRSCFDSRHCLPPESSSSRGLAERGPVYSNGGSIDNAAPLSRGGLRCTHRHTASVKQITPSVEHRALSPARGPGRMRRFFRFRPNVSAMFLFSFITLPVGNHDPTDPSSCRRTLPACS